MRESRFSKAVPAVVLGSAMGFAACFGRAEPAPPMPTPVVREIVGPPSAPAQRTLPVPTVTLSESAEPLIDLEMSDAPVRLVLQKLAELGNLQLIIPANLTRRISVQYARVPVSVALKDVLSRAGLQLGAGSTANLPFDTVTVFYHLPANIDSMSVEAIVRRFGVSRAMAELIVRSRRP